MEGFACHQSPRSSPALAAPPRLTMTCCREGVPQNGVCKARPRSPYRSGAVSAAFPASIARPGSPGPQRITYRERRCGSEKAQRERRQRAKAGLSYPSARYPFRCAQLLIPLAGFRSGDKQSPYWVFDARIPNTLSAPCQPVPSLPGGLSALSSALMPGDVVDFSRLDQARYDRLSAKRRVTSGDNRQAKPLYMRQVDDLDRKKADNSKSVRG